MDIKIILCDGTYYIGELESTNNNIVNLKNVYTINSTIRDDKILVLGNIKYVDSSKMVFCNYQYIANADNNTVKSYLEFIEKDK